MKLAGDDFMESMKLQLWLFNRCFGRKDNFKAKVSFPEKADKNCEAVVLLFSCTVFVAATVWVDCNCKL